MIFDRSRRLLLVAGGLLLVLAAVTIWAQAASAGLEVLKLHCSSNSGCHTDNPLLYTVMSFAYRAAMPLIVAGLIFVASSQALVVLATPRSIDSDGDDMGTVEPSSAARQHGVARRLWIFAGALIAASAGLGLWSESPTVQEATLNCFESNCTSTPVFILAQLSYTLVPAGMLAGLLVLGMALVVTNGRLVRESTTRSNNSARPGVWDGRNHEPFKRPGAPTKRIDGPQ